MRFLRKFLKSKDLWLMRRFGTYFGPHKKWLILSIASIPLTTAAGIAFLWLVERIIDDFILPGDAEGLKTYSLILGGVLLVNFLLDGLYSYAFAKAGGYAILDMRQIGRASCRERG